MDERVAIATPDHVTLEFELAGLGSRFCAHLIDALLIVLIVIVLVGLGVTTGAVGGAFTDPLGSAAAGSWGVALLLLLVFAVVWGYYLFFEGLIMPGLTPGKLELGIRVVREDGLPIGLYEAALRNLVRGADALPPPTYLVGGLVMLFDRRRRRLGDMAAGTLVVWDAVEPAADTAAGARWAERVEQGQSRLALSLPNGRLTGDQVELVERFLARCHDLPEDRREALAWQIAKPILPLIGENPSDWEGRADRTAECERVLADIQQRVRSSEANGARARRTDSGHKADLF